MASRKIARALVAGACTMVLLTGCGSAYEVIPKEQLNLVETNYDAVDEMLSNAKVKIERDAPILVATFVDLDDVTRTSTLGRVMGELCASRLAQRGYKVVNAKVRPDSIVIKPKQGEFVLSRDVEVLTREHGARAVLVGTYSRTNVGEKIRSVNQRMEVVDPQLLTRPHYVTSEKRIFETIDDSIYISLRLVSAKDHSVMAAHDYRIVCDEGVESLILAGEDDSFMRY